MTPTTGVDVIVPAWQSEAWLGEAIASVLAQTFRDFDLWVVDDGSTDGTHGVALAWAEKDARVHALRKPNGGQGSARNHALRLGRRPFVAFLDADDVWLPEKLARQVEALSSHPEADFCYTDIRAFGDDPVAVRSHRSGASETVELAHLKRCGLPTAVPSSHLYLRSAFDRVGLFDENPEWKGLEDNEWSLRGAELRGLRLAEPLTLYRVHSAQITSRAALRPSYGLALEAILRKHLGLFSRDEAARRFRALQLVHLALLCRDSRRARRLLAEFAPGIGARALTLRFFSLLSPGLYSAFDRARRALRG